MAEDEGGRPVFVQNVTAVAGFAYGVQGADIHCFGNGVPLYVLERWRPPPESDPGFLRELPSRMLNARFAVVEFTGREEELADLRRWREEGPRLAARWLHGPGGQGKTRLAAQLAHESLAEGWKVVTATHGPGSVLPPPGSQDLRLDGATGLLLIVDYADRWPLSHLTWLFSNSLLHRPAVRTRLLLLARGGDGWPAVRAALANLQAGASAQFLPDLPDDGTGRRTEMFAAAVASFTAHYGAAGTDIAPPGSLGHPDFGLTLAVHMAALVAVDARVTGRRPARDMAGLTIYLLDREHLHWEQLYGDASGKLTPAGHTYATPPKAMNQTVFAAALTGPMPRPAGIALLEGLRLPLPAGRVADDHTVCYPPGTPGQETVLEPLYPDRLAEDFLALTLPGHRAEYPDQPWASGTATSVLARAGDGAPPAWTPRAITFLATAARRWPHVGPGHLFPLLRADPRLAVAGGSAALTALADLDDITPELLELIASTFPKRSHADLDPGMADITRRVTPHRLAAAGDPSALAAAHADLGARLANAGLHRQALIACEKAVAESRRLGAAPILGISLTDLSNVLSLLGRREEALAAVEESANLHRRLAADDSVQPQFLAALVNLADSLRLVGRWDDALAAAREAVALSQHLTEREGLGAEPYLYSSLLALSVTLWQNTRRAEALDDAREALSLVRRLDEREPGAYTFELASTLDNLGSWLTSAGRPEDGLSLQEEALVLFRRLAELVPGSYVPELAGCLANLGGTLSAVGRSREALVVTEEAVALLRPLAEANPAAYEARSADALHNLGLRLSRAGRLQEARAAAEEVLAIYRRLAANDPAAYERDLAASLDVIGRRRSEARLPQEAMAARKEAVAVYRRLDQGAPSDLARALTALSDSLMEAGLSAEAAVAAEEAVALYRHSDALKADSLVLPLRNLSLARAQLGQWRASLAAAEETTHLYRRLSESANPLYRHHLAASLTVLASVRINIGEDLAKALAAVNEAIAVYERLLPDSGPVLAARLQDARLLAAELSQEISRR